MDYTLPAGDRGRLLALGVTACVLAFVWLAIVSPLIDLYQGRAAKLHNQQTVLAHMNGLAAVLPDLRNRAKASRATDDQQTFAVPGASDAVAAANMQNVLQELATDAGGNVTSFETVPAQTVGTYRRIGVKLSLHVPWTVLVSLLKSIGEAHPPMLVDDLEIHALPQLNTPGPRKMEADFTVYAFRSTAGDPK